MAYLEELLPEFRKGAKIRINGWAKDEYIYLGKNGLIYDERDKPFDLTNEELFANWKPYQEPIDWDYIIKNKCLCWFWDEGESETGKTAGELIEIRKNSSLPFIKGTTDKGYSIGYSHCRPIRKDEVTFYEERKDE